MNVGEFLETLQEQGHLKIKVGPNSENDTRQLPLLVVDVCDEHGEVVLDITPMTAERLAIMVGEKISDKIYLDGNPDASNYLVSIRDGEKSEEIFGILKIEQELLIMLEQDESTIPEVGIPELTVALLRRDPGLKEENILIRHGGVEYPASEIEVDKNGNLILVIDN